MTQLIDQEDLETLTIIEPLTNEEEEYQVKVTKLKPQKRRSTTLDLPYAAGVYLFDRNYPNFVAAILRADRSKYGMICGKQEKGETLAECAIREAREECGVIIDEDHLGPRYFSVSENIDPDRPNYWVSIWAVEVDFQTILLTDSEEGEIDLIDTSTLLRNSGFSDYHRRMVNLFNIEIPAYIRKNKHPADI